MLRLLALTFIAFVEDFLENRASPARIAHINIGACEVEFRTNFSHGTRIRQIVGELARSRMRALLLSISG